MNLIHCWFFFIALFKVVIEAASTEIVSESESASSKEKDVSDFKILSDDIIAKIGEYLVFPQMELGFMNRRLHYIFFKYLPLKTLMRARFGIPELMDSTYSQDLSTLTRLSHVQEPIYFAFSISMALLQDTIFNFNKKALLRYFYRIFSSLPNEHVASFVEPNMIEGYKLCFAIRFIYEEDYENAISISKSRPNFTETVFNQHYKLEQVYNLIKFTKESNAHEDYKLILRSISGNRQKTNFLIASIFANVPKSFYAHELCMFLDLFEKVITQICTDIFIFPIDFDIFYVLSDLLDIERARNVTVDQNIFNYIQLMIRIRFETESDEVIQNEILNNDYASNPERLAKLALAASSHADKIDLARFIHSLDESAIVAYNSTHDITPGDIKLISIIPELNFNLKELFNSLDQYKIRCIRYDASNNLIYVDTKRIDSRLNIPETFTSKLSSSTEIVSLLLYTILSHFNVDESVEETRHHLELSIESFLQIPYVIETVHSRTDPFVMVMPSCEILWIIAETPRVHEFLQSIRGEMKLVDVHSVKLFEKSVIQLYNIVKIDESESSIGPILVYLGTNTRFSNFEAFTGKSIAYWFENYVVMHSRNDVLSFLVFSAAFHYWFNGPDRARLMDYLSTEFLQLLAKEMDQESADYIQAHISSRA